MQRTRDARWFFRRRLGPAGWAVLAAGLLGASTLHAGFFEWFFRYDLRVISATDLTPAGALLRVPTTAAPVYYIGVNAGYRDFGAGIPGDKLPAVPTMVQSVVRALAKSGYLPADAQHPATQFIVFSWGTFYPRMFFGNPDLPNQQLNRYAMARFLGGDKLRLVPEHPAVWPEELQPGLTRLDPDAEAIWTAASDQLYVVALLGFEYPIKEPKHPHLLWRSKVGAPARGLVMADTLPTMLVIAAPYLGHDTPRPVLVRASDRFKPTVEVGPPKFEEYLESGQLPVVDLSAASGGRRK